MNECIFCKWSVPGVELSRKDLEDALMNLKPLLKCQKTGQIANKRCPEFETGNDWPQIFSVGD